MKVAVWIGAALFLVLVADYQPKFVMWLILLLIASVALIHSDTIVSFLQTATSSVTTKNTASSSATGTIPGSTQNGKVLL